MPLRKFVIEYVIRRQSKNYLRLNCGGMKTGNTVLEGLEDGIKYLGNHIISIFTT
jgi:hypothetical protein